MAACVLPIELHLVVAVVEVVLVGEVVELRLEEGEEEVVLLQDVHQVVEEDRHW